MITVNSFLDFCKTQNIELVDDATGRPVEEVLKEKKRQENINRCIYKNPECGDETCLCRFNEQETND